MTPPDRSNPGVFSPQGGTPIGRDAPTTLYIGELGIFAVGRDDVRGGPGGGGDLHYLLP